MVCTMCPQPQVVCAPGGCHVLPFAMCEANGTAIFQTWRTVGGRLMLAIWVRSRPALSMLAHRLVRSLVFGESCGVGNPCQSVCLATSHQVASGSWACLAGSGSHHKGCLHWGEGATRSSRSYNFGWLSTKRWHTCATALVVVALGRQHIWEAVAMHAA